MTTYYRDGDVWITSSGVRLNGRDYALSELRQVWHRAGRRSWGTIANRLVLYDDGDLVLVDPTGQVIWRRS